MAKLIKLLTSTKAKIVITSTWRLCNGFEAVLELGLQKEGLSAGTVLGSSPQFGHLMELQFASRADEIIAWLAVYRQQYGGDACESFVILDDLPIWHKMHAKLEHLERLMSDRLITTDGSEGLRTAGATAAAEILSRSCDQKFWEDFDSFVSDSSFQSSLAAARSQLVNGDFGMRPPLFAEEDDALRMCRSCTWLQKNGFDASDEVNRLFLACARPPLLLDGKH